jgi:triacylglycerol lipase
MSKGTIVLAHGLFGFGDLLPGFQAVNYFNGIKQLLKDQDWNVVAPSVNPVGSVEQRGEQLAAQIPQTNAGERLHIIAHSMGGLDARQALKAHDDLALRVTTLVTIGTPHKGSAVADALVGSGNALLAALLSMFPAKLKQETGAFESLTTKACERFNATTPDRKNVRYINVAGDASRSGNELPFFKLAARIGGFSDVTNDGVVTRDSALRDGNEHLDDWPVDHLGEIGWSTSTVGPGGKEEAVEQHLLRYKAILNVL